MDKKPKDEEQLAKALEPLIRQMKGIYDNAVAAYTPPVVDICSRQATENASMDIRIPLKVLPLPPPTPPQTSEIQNYIALFGECPSASSVSGFVDTL